MSLVTPTLHPYGYRGTACTDDEKTAATTGDGDYTVFSKCFFVGWFAPAGFPESIDQFEGPSAVISGLGDSLYGFSGTTAMGGAVYRDFAMQMGDGSFSFSMGMSLFSVFNGEFNFASSFVAPSATEPTPVYGVDSSGDASAEIAMEAEGALSVAISGSVSLDMSSIKTTLQTAILDKMKLPKLIQKIGDILDLGDKPRCKKLGVPGSVCKMVPGLADTIAGVTASFLTPAEVTLVGLQTALTAIIDGIGDASGESSFSATLDTRVVGAGVRTQATIEWSGSIGSGLTASIGPFTIDLDSTDITGPIIDQVVKFMDPLINQIISDLTSSTGDPQAIFDKQLKKASDQINSAASGAFDEIAGAAGSVMAAISSAWKGSSNFFSSTFGAEERCTATSHNYKKCMNCDLAVRADGRQASGATGGPFIITSDMNGGNNPAQNKNSCTQACLNIQFSVYNEWVAASTFEARRCSREYNTGILAHRDLGKGEELTFLDIETFQPGGGHSSLFYGFMDDPIQDEDDCRQLCSNEVQCTAYAWSTEMTCG